MEDVDWFASADAVAMLTSLFPLPGPHSAYDNTRLARLYLAACARRQWPFLPWSYRQLVEVGEVLADDLPRAVNSGDLMALAESLPGRPGTPEDWAELTNAVQVCAGGHPTVDSRPFLNDDHYQQVSRIVSFLYYREVPPFRLIRAAFHYADYVRDIFARTIRRVPFEPAWRTEPSVGLARAIYETRAFDRMPILADALEEAGCENREILSHCRDGATAHVRGCWVVDLVLGKT